MSNEGKPNPSDPNAAASNAAGGTPLVYSEHTYRVYYVPPGCEDYVFDDLIELFVNNPPPADVTLNPGGGCDGVKVKLVS